MSKIFPSDLSLKQCAADTRTLVVRMVAAHMKYASPELCRRNSEASHGKLPSSGWANHSSVSSHWTNQRRVLPAPRPCCPRQSR